MYTELERNIVGKVKSIGPPIYREQRDQFAQSLPLLALLSVVLAALLGGWLGVALLVLRSLFVSPMTIIALVFSVFFWLEFLPPILWAASFFPLQKRRLAGWRLFVAGMALSLVASLLTLSIIGLLFSAAILYFTLQSYDEFDRPWRW